MDFLVHFVIKAGRPRTDRVFKGDEPVFGGQVGPKLGVLAPPGRPWTPWRKNVLFLKKDLKMT